MTQQYSDGNSYTPAPTPPAPKGGLSKGVWAAIAGGAVALVAIIVLVLVLAFGGDKEEKAAPAPAPVTVTATPEAPAPTYSAPAESKASSPQVLSDAQFVDYVLEQRPVLGPLMTDSEIVDLAKNSCERFDEGDTAMDVIYDSVSNVTSEDEAEAVGFVIGVGVQNYCDQHLERLTAELDSMDA